jgi:hypothetical protein
LPKWVTHKAIMNFFTALKQSPIGILPGQTQWVASFEEYTDFVGLKDYKTMEDKYLPKGKIDEKYKEAKKIVG